MAEEPLGGVVQDWHTARINAEKLVRGFRGFEEAANILATADEALSHNAAAKGAYDRIQAEIKTAREELATAQQRRKDAQLACEAVEEQMRRRAAAAEQAAKDAEADGAQRKAAQTTMVAALDDELTARRAVAERQYGERIADLEARVAELNKQAADAEAQLEAIGRRALGK